MKKELLKPFVLVGCLIAVTCVAMAYSNREHSSGAAAAPVIGVPQGVVSVNAKLVQDKIFAGGDGTARDVCAAVGETLTVMGIPAGVKIHSPAFARTPETAGRLVVDVLRGKVRGHCQQEVLDIDEEAYRSGKVQTRLYGYLRLPRTTGLQNRKAGTPVSEASVSSSPGATPTMRRFPKAMAWTVAAVCQESQMPLISR